jgi:hypothetical protein
MEAVFIVEGMQRSRGDRNTDTFHNPLDAVPHNTGHNICTFRRRLGSETPPSQQTLTVDSGCTAEETQRPQVVSAVFNTTVEL